ncbi:hypothetical protein HMPREF9140_01591 [Prevotella micans F0438]|jgi:HAD hydrolase, family IA, variant 3|uniref:HAD family phosphatase n=1 Tax=Prevotella micans F0438 TaxID=883158 RepID=H1Q3V3_9BACT|nr:HAD family phosphatase [Prevotella micans]EHO68551.1 hypothetical protein HMPREF9140_01591 [Prevotella micans F0438]
MIKACLFDLDGVVFDTEPLYTEFWREIGKEFVPGIKDFEYKIKGQTLVQIFDVFFGGITDRNPERTVQQTKVTNQRAGRNDQPINQKAEITDRLNRYEQRMRYEYVPGFEEFIVKIRKEGMRTALATSSNREKMQNVYNQHNEFREFFDEILTAEEFDESKPSPDCYLKAAARLGAAPEECVVFEDSFNGLKAGKASGAYVVGLATTNSPEEIDKYCELVIKNFRNFELKIG